MPGEPEEDVLELDTPIEGEQEEQDEQQQDNEANDDGDGGSAGFTIEIEGEEQVDETPLVRELRQQNRDQARELAEYRKTQQPKIEVGQKPTLEGCEYDDLRFEQEYEAWQERKRAAEDQDRKASEHAEIRNQQFRRAADNYRGKLAALPLPEEEKAAAEKVVTDALPELLQSAVITYADDPAKVVVALAKHPAKLAALAQEADPIRFILAMKEIERNLKVVNRKKPPEPEAGTIVRGSAAISANRDKELERLEKEADRTGERTALVAYKRKMKNAA